MWNQIGVLSEDEVYNDTFSVNTLVRIDNSDPILINNDPKLRATFRNEHVVVAIDNIMHLLDKDLISGKNQNTKVSAFPSRIDCITISSDGQLIVCGLSDGNIVGMRTTSLDKGPAFNTIINSQNIDEDTFVNVIEWNSEYYFCCTNGVIYKVHGIDHSMIKIESGIDHDETISNNILLDVVNSKRTNVIVSSYAISFYEGEPLHIYCGEGNIFFKSQHFDHRISLKGIQHLQSDNIVTFALGENGRLYELCQYTGMAMPIDCAENILDFIITTTNDEGIEILALTQNSSNSKSLKVFDYPNMNCKVSLPISNHIWLIDQPKSSENIFYFGGDRSSVSSFIESIHLHMVSESQPEKRLQTLLTKGMLVEAEELAKKFNLDPQPIYEAKAKRILQEMAMIDQNVDTLQKGLDELISVAKKITNTDFLLQLRNLDMPDRKVMRNLLEFMTEQINFDKYPKIGEEIKEQLLRLNTLQLIDPNECMMQWQKFVQHPNLGNYCAKYMETNMPAACLILKQHASSILPHMRKESAVKMLREIPSDIEPFSIIQWMRHYFPLMSEEFPETMPEILDWVVAKTISYERSNDWPAIGIEFGKKMMDICKNAKFIFADHRRHYDLSLGKLSQIIDAMEELLVLKNQYNLHVNFEEYFENSVEDCAFNLLQRINIKNLPDLVNKFLFVVFTEKGKKLQTTLTRYIDYLMQYRSALHIWLVRAVACLQLITNQEVKLQYALAIAKSSPVPWPEEMNPIIELRNSSHQYAKEIDNEYKMQQVKMLRIKYGWRANSSGAPTKFVQRMVTQNRDELLSDLETFKKFSSDINPETNFYTVYHLASVGHMHKAQQYLKTLSIDEMRMCYQKIALIVPLMIDDYIKKPELYQNLMELLQFVMDKDIEEECKEKIKDLMNLQLLKKSALNISITLQDLYNETTVVDYLDIGIQKLLQILKNTEKNLSGILWHNVKVLSTALKLNRFDVIFKLAQIINNVQFTTLLARIFRDETGNNQNYIKMAVTLIVQQFHATSSDGVCPDSESYAFPMAHYYIQKVKGMDMMDVQQLAHFVKIGMNAYDITQFQEFLRGNETKDDDTIQDALESLNKLETATNTRRRDSMSIFDEVNHVNPTPVVEHKSAAVVKALSLVLHAIVHDLKPASPFYDLFKDLLNVDEPVDRTKLYSSIDQILKMKMYTIVFSTLHCIRTQQKFSTKKLLASSLESTYYRKILKSALNQKEPQFIVLVAILRSDPNPEDMLRSLKEELKSGLPKMNCLELSEKFCEATGNVVEAQLAKEAHLKYKYYMQLRQLDPSLKDDFQIKFPDLFTSLSQKIFDIQLLDRMSRDFGWNYQKVLIAQITTILSGQELEFDTQTNELGEEVIVIQNSTDKIRSLCDPYLAQITDFKSLSACLYEILNTINPYFYELFLCILNILAEIKEIRTEVMQWNHILLFLKHKMVKKRERRIGQFETDWCNKRQGESTIMPKISKYRLPFLMVVTEALQDFLGDVVTIEDCVEWFPLVKFHSYMRGAMNPSEIHHENDTLCMTVFKKVLSEHMSSNKENSTWSLQPVNNAFLQSVMHVVNNMKDIHRILLVLYMVFSNAPEGADQLEAALQCYKFVKQHQTALNESARSKDLAIKIKGKYSVLKVQHQLHLYGLYDDDLSELISNPLELIRALYNRVTSNNITDTKCDINQVVENFAKLFGLNLYEIQTNLLKQWLAIGTSSSENGAPLEMTFNEDEFNSTITPTQDDCENTSFSVEKAYYVLRSWKPHEASQFLINNIFADQECVNTGRQLQLFECLIKLANKDMNQSFLDFVEKSRYIALKCVHHLKPFGYTMSIEKFNAYDKIKILKQIWTTNASNPKALNVITYICLGYNIYEPKIWSNVLRQMVALHMADDLNAIIDKIAIIPEIVHSDGIVVAFNYLIRLPFKNMSKTKTDEQDETLSKALFILQSCPVKHKLNFVDLVENCVALKQIHFGAVFLALSKDELKPEIRNLLMPLRHDTLKEDIINLEEYDVFPFVTAQAIKLLELN